MVFHVVPLTDGSVRSAAAVARFCKRVGWYIVDITGATGELITALEAVHKSVPLQDTVVIVVAAGATVKLADGSHAIAIVRRAQSTSEQKTKNKELRSIERRVPYELIPLKQFANVPRWFRNAAVLVDVPLDSVQQEGDKRLLTCGLATTQGTLFGKPWGQHAFLSFVSRAFGEFCAKKLMETSCDDNHGSSSGSNRASWDDVCLYLLQQLRTQETDEPDLAKVQWAPLAVRRNSKLSKARQPIGLGFDVESASMQTEWGSSSVGKSSQAHCSVFDQCERTTITLEVTLPVTLGRPTGFLSAMEVPVSTDQIQDPPKDEVVYTTSRVRPFSACTVRGGSSRFSNRSAGSRGGTDMGRGCVPLPSRCVWPRKPKNMGISSRPQSAPPRWDPGTVPPDLKSARVQGRKAATAAMRLLWQGIMSVASSIDTALCRTPKDITNTPSPEAEQPEKLTSSPKISSTCESPSSSRTASLGSSAHPPSPTVSQSLIQTPPEPLTEQEDEQCYLAALQVLSTGTPAYQSGLSLKLSAVVLGHKYRFYLPSQRHVTHVDAAIHEAGWTIVGTPSIHVIENAATTPDAVMDGEARNLVACDVEVRCPRTSPQGCFIPLPGDELPNRGVDGAQVFSASDKRCLSFCLAVDFPYPVVQQVSLVGHLAARFIPSLESYIDGLSPDMIEPPVLLTLGYQTHPRREVCSVHDVVRPSMELVGENGRVRYSDTADPMQAPRARLTPQGPVARQLFRGKLQDTKKKLHGEQRTVKKTDSGHCPLKKKGGLRAATNAGLRHNRKATAATEYLSVVRLRAKAHDNTDDTTDVTSCSSNNSPRCFVKLRDDGIETVVAPCRTRPSSFSKHAADTDSPFIFHSDPRLFKPVESIRARCGASFPCVPLGLCKQHYKAALAAHGFHARTLVDRVESCRHPPVFNATTCPTLRMLPADLTQKIICAVPINRPVAQPSVLGLRKALLEAAHSFYEMVPLADHAGWTCSQACRCVAAVREASPKREAHSAVVPGNAEDGVFRQRPASGSAAHRNTDAERKLQQRERVHAKNAAESRSAFKALSGGDTRECGRNELLLRLEGLWDSRFTISGQPNERGPVKYRVAEPHSMARRESHPVPQLLPKKRPPSIQSDATRTSTSTSLSRSLSSSSNSNSCSSSNSSNSSEKRKAAEAASDSDNLSNTSASRKPRNEKRLSSSGSSFTYSSDGDGSVRRRTVTEKDSHPASAGRRQSAMSNGSSKQSSSYSDGSSGSPKYVDAGSARGTEPDAAADPVRHGNKFQRQPSNPHYGSDQASNNALAVAGGLGADKQDSPLRESSAEYALPHPASCEEDEDANSNAGIRAATADGAIPPSTMVAESGFVLHQKKHLGGNDTTLPAKQQNAGEPPVEHFEKASEVQESGWEESSTALQIAVAEEHEAATGEPEQAISPKERPDEKDSGEEAKGSNTSSLPSRLCRVSDAAEQLQEEAQSPADTTTHKRNVDQSRSEDEVADPAVLVSQGEDVEWRPRMQLRRLSQQPQPGQEKQGEEPGTDWKPRLVLKRQSEQY